jgi:hypothetical protein
MGGGRGGGGGGAPKAPRAFLVTALGGNRVGAVIKARGWSKRCATQVRLSLSACDGIDMPSVVKPLEASRYRAEPHPLELDLMAGELLPEHRHQILLEELPGVPVEVVA